MTMHGYDYTDDDTILDEEARMAAKRAGLLAVRSSRGIGGPNNAGAFMLINPSMNAVVAGSRYELTSDEVVNYCDDASK